MNVEFKMIPKFLGVILYATLNRKIKLSIAYDIPEDEKFYILKDFYINSYYDNKRNKEFYNLTLILNELENNMMTSHNIRLIENVEYSIIGSNRDIFKIWFRGINITNLNRYEEYKLIGEENNDIDFFENYRIQIYPDWNFLIPNRKKEAIELNNFMYVNPIFEERDFTKNNKKIFVLMPFKDEHYNLIYDDYIKPIIENKGYICERVDDSYYTGDVMNRVWKEINEAEVVVGEISTLNPNVLYELGIAHTLGKKVILLTEYEKKVPFDLKKYRYIYYSVENQTDKNKFVKIFNDLIDKIFFA